MRRTVGRMVSVPAEFNKKGLDMKVEIILVKNGNPVGVESVDCKSCAHFSEHEKALGNMAFNFKEKCEFITKAVAAVRADYSEEEWEINVIANNSDHSFSGISRGDGFISPAFIDVVKYDNSDSIPTSQLAMAAGQMRANAAQR